MIFTRKHIDLIRMGKKTQTTRLKRPTIFKDRSYKLRTDFYSKAYSGGIRILRIDLVSLRDYTLKDARREGYSNLGDFFKMLDEVNKQKINKNRKVWRVRFKYQA